MKATADAVGARWLVLEAQAAIIWGRARTTADLKAEDGVSRQGVRAFVASPVHLTSAIEAPTFVLERQRFKTEGLTFEIEALSFTGAPLTFEIEPLFLRITRHGFTVKHRSSSKPSRSATSASG